MFPVIEIGTLLKHCKLKLFSQTEKRHFRKLFGDGQNLWYSVIMILCHKVAL